MNPGLRPDAPNETCSRSRRVTDAPPRARKYAVAQPMIPPPTTTVSFGRTLRLDCASARRLHEAPPDFLGLGRVVLLRSLVVAAATDPVLDYGAEVREELGRLHGHDVRVDDRKRTELVGAAHDLALEASGDDRAPEHDALRAVLLEDAVAALERIAGDGGGVIDHVLHVPVDRADGAAVRLDPIQADEVLELRHGLPVVGDDRETVPEVPREENGRLQRPHDGHVRELARDVDAGVVTAADHERVHALPLRLHDLAKYLDLDQVLRQVVIDVARAVLEVRDLDVGVRPEVRLERLADEVVVRVRSERIAESDPH